MKLLDEYEIPFNGLNEEIHEFSFKAGPGFFEFFQNPDYNSGNLDIMIMLVKKPVFLELKFNISGTIRLLCDRCLEEFDHPISVKELLIIKLGDKFEELDNEVIIVPREETRINVAQYIYEFAILSLPFRKIHPESGCNPEMLRRIKELNNDTFKDTDPRWDKLKKIDLNNNKNGTSKKKNIQDQEG